MMRNGKKMESCLICAVVEKKKEKLSQLSNQLKLKQLLKIFISFLEKKNDIK